MGDKILEENNQTKQEINVPLKRGQLLFRGRTIFTSFLRDKYNLVFLVILLFTILFRLKYFRMDSIWNDAAFHLWSAIQAVENPLNTLFSPDYYLGDYAISQSLTAFYYLFFTSDIFIAGKLMALTYSVFGVIFIYLLGIELKNRIMGLLAALLLAVNPVFYFYSTRPLGDAPLTVSIILLLYFIVKLEKEKKVLWGILTALAFFGAMLHKVQASLFVLGYVLYCIFFKRNEMFKNRAVLYSWSIPVGGVLIAHFIANTFFNANLLGRLFGLMTQFRGVPYGLEAAGMLEWIFSWYLIPFVFLGIFLIVFYKEKRYYSFLVLGFFYWIYFEINVDNTQDRYMLPLLPIALLLAVYAVLEIGQYLVLFFNEKKKWLQSVVAIFIILLIAWHYYGTADKLVASKQYGYTGYPEAGKWLKENVPEDGIIFAGSPRSIRTFAEREWYSGPKYDSPIYGGSIYWLRGERYHHNYDNYDFDNVMNPDAQQNFADDVTNLSKNHDIFVEIDIWEYTQPRWYYNRFSSYPLTQDGVNFFLSLGFKLVKVVEREVPTKEGYQKMPVIFILKKDRVANSIS
ncbi:glycosyltransferase family 39 protein [Candidatus Woesearchaeota archaeon]|nr:glycosyltransferase family 39 protein [Candidatus Woesearchaeota archaeon]